MLDAGSAFDSGFCFIFDLTFPTCSFGFPMCKIVQYRVLFSLVALYPRFVPLCRAPSCAVPPCGSL